MEGGGPLRPGDGTGDIARNVFHSVLGPLGMLYGIRGWEKRTLAKGDPDLQGISMDGCT